MRPSNPIHPGEMLLNEFLKPSEMSQRTFAEEVGWSTSKLSKLIRGKCRITAYSALDLAKALKTTPELWLQLQIYCDLRQAEIDTKG